MCCPAAPASSGQTLSFSEDLDQILPCHGGRVVRTVAPAGPVAALPSFCASGHPCPRCAQTHPLRSFAPLPHAPLFRASLIAATHRIQAAALRLALLRLAPAPSRNPTRSAPTGTAPAPPRTILRRNDHPATATPQDPHHQHHTSPATHDLAEIRPPSHRDSTRSAPRSCASREREVCEGAATEEAVSPGSAPRIACAREVAIAGHHRTRVQIRRQWNVKSRIPAHNNHGVPLERSGGTSARELCGPVLL